MRITDISYDVESSEVKISLSLFVKKWAHEKYSIKDSRVYK
jgi:hypothetical protein